MKIFIGCAAYRDLTAQTAQSQIRVHSNTALPGVEEIATGIAMGYHAPRNCEQLAQSAIDGKFTHFLYHDADIEYEPRHVQRAADTLKAIEFRDGHDRSMVGAMYPSSSGPQVLVGKPDPSDTAWTNFTPGVTIARALHVGFGFVLMPVSIFEGLRKPWFADEWGGVHNELVTPDVRFCNIVRERGWNVYADSGLDVKHWVRMPLTIRDSLALRR